MKDEFLVTLLTSSGEKQCLQRFKNVVMCFNRVLRDCDTVVKTQCWNLRGPSARNKADEVRDSLENSDLVICVIDPTATQGVRDDVVNALDWVRESFQMAFFAVKERNMYIYVKEASTSGTGRKQAQRAVFFLETLYKKGYNPITYPSENAFALTLLYQLCNMVRSELWCCDFPKDKGFDLEDIFTPEGIATFGINFPDLPWVKNCKEYCALKTEIVALRKDLENKGNKYQTAFTLDRKEYRMKHMEQEMLHSYCLLSRFFCRQNISELTQIISDFIKGNIAAANKRLNTAQLVRRISAFRKNPAGLKSAGGTKMEFDYLLNCYLLKIHLVLTLLQDDFTITVEKLYNDVLSLSQGLVTLVEQMGINDEAGAFFFEGSKFIQAKILYESSVRMFEAFPKEKQKKTIVLGIDAYHCTASCLEEELGDVKMVEGENLPRKTISALKNTRVLYHKALSLTTPLLKRYPMSYWPLFASIYVYLFDFYIKTGQQTRAARLSEEIRPMVSKLGVPSQNPTDSPQVEDEENVGNDVNGNETISEVQSDSYSDYQPNPDPAQNQNSSKQERCDFIRLLDKLECQVYLKYNLPDQAQKCIPKGIENYINAPGADPFKVEEDLFAWKDSEEVLPDIFPILKWEGSEEMEEESYKNQTSTINSKAENTESKPTTEEETVPLEGDLEVIWDIAQVLLDQARIYSQKKDYVKSIRYSAAAIKSINQRLVKNPTLIRFMKGAFDLLLEGYDELSKIPESLECMLQRINMTLPLFEGFDVWTTNLFTDMYYDCVSQLVKVRESDHKKISYNIFIKLSEFMVQNYAKTNPNRTLEILNLLRYNYVNVFKDVDFDMLYKIDKNITYVQRLANHSFR